MTPAELARIQRIVELRAAQLRLAEASHARAVSVHDAARAAAIRATAEVDDAAEKAAEVDGRGSAVDDLVETRLRIAFLSRLAAQRAKESTAAEAERSASSARLQASNVTSEQMKTWFQGAAAELRANDDRREEALRDELAARRGAKKEST